jgi:hypothetical protein
MSYKINLIISNNRVISLVSKILGFNKKGFKFVEILNLDYDNKKVNYLYKNKEFDTLLTTDELDLFEYYISKLK